MIDQRNSKRYKTLWKIFLKNKGTYELAGYLMDISDGGARFFLDHTEGFDLAEGKKMTLLVKTQSPEVNEKELTAEISWIKEWKGTEAPFEVGIRFTKPSDLEQQDIQSLIQNFDRKP